MKNKITKLFVFAMTAVILSVTLWAPAAAAVLDTNAKGSLKIVETSVSAGEAIPGLSVSVYKVASIVNAESIYSLTADFSDLFVDVNSMNTAEKQTQAATSVWSYINSKSVSPTKTVSTDENGEAYFENLEIGLYLVSVEKGESYGVSELPSPFFAQLPVTTDDGEAFIYDVTAAPKTDSESRFTNVTVTKLWDDDNNSAGKRTEAVTVELYADGVLYDTVALSAANSWTYTWESLSKLTEWTAKEINIPANYVAKTATDGYRITVVNTYKSGLPQTGQNNVIILVLSAAGIVLIAAGAALCIKSRSKKKDHN